MRSGKHSYVVTISSKSKIRKFIVVSSNGLNGRLSILLSASNKQAGNHPSISGQSRLALSISSKFPNVAKDVVIEARSAQELSSLLSVNL